MVPGAGVGTAYSARAMDAARAIGGEWFSTGTLTEDYELALKQAQVVGAAQEDA